MHSSATQACAKKYRDGLAKIFHDQNLEGFLRLTGGNATRRLPRPAGVQLASCFTGFVPTQWGGCCSGAATKECFPSVAGSPSTREAECCRIGPGSTSHRALPALQETALLVQLRQGAPAMRVAQDGFLRPFDVSTVLWPAGYLLALWLQRPAVCDSLVGASVTMLLMPPTVIYNKLVSR